MNATGCALLLEITNSVTSRLDFRQVVDALSTNLFRVMQCDVSALLLPDSESGDLRVTILYNPDARGPFREGSLVPMNSSISGQVMRKAKSIRIDSFEQVREDPEIYGNPDGQLLYERVIAGRPESRLLSSAHRPRPRGWRSDALQAFGQCF